MAPLKGRPASASTGHIEFRNVTFQYPGAEEPALTGVSFTAHAGEVTAIIGCENVMLRFGATGMSPSGE